MKKKLLLLLLLLFPVHGAHAQQKVDLAQEYPFGGISSLSEGIGRLVEPAFSIAGLAVLVFFIWGAAKLVFSGGDKNEIAAAREMITHAIIGFILLILMFFIFQFLMDFLGLHGFQIIR